jgi:hypothetical protein
MTEKEKSVEEKDDSALEEALMRQRRPVGPATLKDAREEIERLLVPGLVQNGLSEPEARIEAMNVIARFERQVIAEKLEKVVKGAGHV